jgi:hypothetical protein
MILLQRINRVVEFLPERGPEKLVEHGTVEALQKDLDTWLHHYNHEHPQRGYRNKGLRPMETFELGKKKREKLLKKAA